jgi:hypothetical protein
MCIIIDLELCLLQVGYCIVCYMFVSFPRCYVLVTHCVLLLFVFLFCVLLFCVFCVFVVSSHVLYSCFSSICVQVYGQLPLNGNRTAVNKYHVIQDTYFLHAVAMPFKAMCKLFGKFLYTLSNTLMI